MDISARPAINAYVNLICIQPVLRTPYVSLQIDFRGETYRGSRKAKKDMIEFFGGFGRKVTMVLEYKLRYRSYLYLPRN